MKDVNSPKVFVVSANKNQNPPKEFAFRNYEPSLYDGSSESRVWEAARATSAAPIYLSPFLWNGLLLEDGGFVANNPVFLARNEALTIWPKCRINLILSIGTGFYNEEYEPATNNNNNNISAVLSQTVSEIKKLALSSERTHEQFEKERKAQGSLFKYERLNIKLKESIPLNETNPTILKDLTEQAKEYINNNEDRIKEIVALIIAED